MRGALGAEVEMTDEYRDFKARANGQGSVGNEGVDSNRQGKGHHPHTVPTKNLTTGWSPTCQCDAPRPNSPSTVLDPFSGSGTVGLVAQRMNRDAILIEISPEYAEMARKRIEGDAPLFANVEVNLNNQKERTNETAACVFKRGNTGLSRGIRNH